MTYAMANIMLPILIKEDRSIEPLTEYISIQIAQCDVLPEKTDEGLIKKTLLEQINESIDRLKDKEKNVSQVVSDVLVKDNDINKDKESLRISMDDLLTRPPRIRHNTSFKNKPNRVKRRSAKQYSQ